MRLISSLRIPGPDRYPDSVTYELRDILARQAMAACNNGIPGAGRGDSVAV
jgi:hypothetical protein